MTEPILLSFRGHIEGRTNLTLCDSLNKMISLGQDDIIIEWDSNDLTQRTKQIEIPEISGSMQQNQMNGLAEQYTCIAYDYRNSQYLLGTKKGKVILLSNNSNNVATAKIIYETGALITTVLYSQNMKYIGVCGYSSHSAFLISNMQSLKIEEENPDNAQMTILEADRLHEGAVVAMLITMDQKFVCTIGVDGYILFYEITENSLKYCCRFKIYSNNNQLGVLKQGIAENPNNSGLLAIGGSTFLQEIIINKQKQMPIQYRIRSQIHEQQPILSVSWINQGCLALIMSSYISVWKYNIMNGKAEKIAKLTNLADVMEIVSNSNGLICTKMDGIIYQYVGTQFFNKVRKNLAEIGIEEQNNIEEQKQYEENEDEDQIDQEEQKRKRKKNNFRPKQPELSIAAQLIQIYPQTAIQSFYGTYLETRFLYYNQYGCIIQRTDGEDLLVELQYHDKQRIRRIKFQSKNKMISYFAISDNCFAYSTLNHFYLERQALTYSSTNINKKQYYVEKWDYKWSGIQGIAIGSNWVAIASKLQIKIFDLSGNQLHSICYQRNFLGFAAFQDMLVLTYQAALPIYTIQMYQMKVYTITLDKYKFERKVKIPVKDNQSIKWLGFSQQGILFLQESSEDIRMYHWDRNQWLQVYAGNMDEQRIYIQHIDNYEIFGFQIAQKPGQPIYPTVQPRSVPRKIKLSLCLDGFDFFTSQQNNRLRAIYLKKYILELEHFRIKRWYKYKYSRGVNHPEYSKTKNIMTSEELELAKGQHDLQIVGYIKKIIKSSTQTASQQRTNEQARQRLYIMCSKLVNYENTLVKIKQILQVDSHKIMQETNIENYIKNRSIPPKYSKISRILQLVDMFQGSNE